MLMAADLATRPRTSLRTQLCGDAHLSNFGAFAAPDRRLVFSVNDFDETLPGPFEWDVMRLVASFAVAGRSRGFDTAARATINQTVARAYRESIRDLATMTTFDLWYTRVDVDELLQQWSPGSARPHARMWNTTSPRREPRTACRAVGKLTHLVDGRRRIIADPPLITPVADLLPPERREHFDDWVRADPARLRTHDAGRPPPAARALPLRRRSTQGRRRGQRRHPSVDRAAHRQRRERPADDPDQRGPALSTGTVPGQEQLRQPRPTSRRRPAAHAGSERHHPRLGQSNRSRRRRARLLRPTAVGQQVLAPTSTPWISVD